LNQTSRSPFAAPGAIEALVMDQFNEYTYPIPKEEGGSEIHMMWTDTPCRITCWNGGNETELAMRNPKIEFIVAQHPWLENDCIYADIILPASIPIWKWTISSPTFDRAPSSPTS
jgi:hypothetical protein